MKKTTIIASLILLATAAHAQISVSNLRIDRDGDRASVSFDARIDAAATSRDYKLIMTPEVFGAEGSVALDPIVVETRRTRIRDNRGMDRPIANAHNTENGATVDYAATAPWADWMGEACDLRFTLRSTGCCDDLDLGEVVMPRSTPAAPAPVPATPAPTVRRPENVSVGGMVLLMTRNAEPRPMTSATDGVTMQTLVDSLKIGFAQGSARIDFRSFDNYRALNQLVSILRSRQDIVLEGHIKITGTASPEGSERLNYELAHKRAMAVRNYLIGQVYWLHPWNFEIVNGGQDWDGLRDLVERSYMPWRREVLDIIDNTPADGYPYGAPAERYSYDDAPAERYAHNLPTDRYSRNVTFNRYFHSGASRKAYLMRLDQGRAWRYMERYFYPHLRGAVTVTVFTPTGQGLMQQRGSMPPAQNTEIINRAIDLASARDYTGALALLEQVSDDARAWNPIGVCAVMAGDYESAREYFRLAADAGYAEAQGNLDQINQ
jgi:hypothetical protein